MFHIVAWLVVGALIGGVAGLLMRNDDDQSVFVNVLVGVLGALVAGWIVAPYFGHGHKTWFLATLSGIVVNFFVNKYWTFRSVK